MLKLSVLYVSLFLLTSAYSGERARSPKPYAQLGNYLSARNTPLSMADLIDIINTLNGTSYNDIDQEYDRFIQLSQRYNQVCANLKTRGSAPIYDKFKTHALRAAHVAEKLAQLKADITQLDTIIECILGDETRGQEIDRARMAHPYLVRMLAIIPVQQSELYKRTQKKLAYVEQIKLLDDLQADHNKKGMITAYKTLLLLIENPEQKSIHYAQMSALEKEVQTEEAFFDVSNSISHILISDDGYSAKERYEKVVELCQHTLAKNNDPAIEELCQRERLYYKQLAALEELPAVVELHNNEFVCTAYQSAIGHADSVGINDIRALLAAESDKLAACIRMITQHTDENDNVPTATASSTQALLDATKISKRNIALIFEARLNALSQAEDEKINRVLAKKQSELERLVSLSNALHERAQFYQKHYPETCKTKIEEDQKRARNLALQAFAKNQKVREKLLIEL